VTLSGGKLVLLAGFAAVAVYATWPGADTLDYSTCEPRSWLSRMGASIYGRFFWEQELRNMRELAHGIQELNQDWAEITNSATVRNEKTRRALEEMYAKHPNMAPSESEQLAQELRDHADQIEAQGFIDKFSNINRGIIAEANHCEQIIVEKLKQM
jgi:hypothetical protein